MCVLFCLADFNLLHSRICYLAELNFNYHRHCVVVVVLYLFFLYKKKGPAGSIAVFSSLVFHRSGANTSGSERRAYLAQYAPAPITNTPGEWPQYFAAPFLSPDGKVIPASERKPAPSDTPPAGTPIN